MIKRMKWKTVLEDNCCKTVKQRYFVIASYDQSLKSHWNLQSFPFLKEKNGTFTCLESYIYQILEIKGNKSIKLLYNLPFNCRYARWPSSERR